MLYFRYQPFLCGRFKCQAGDIIDKLIDLTVLDRLDVNLLCVLVGDSRNNEPVIVKSLVISLCSALRVQRSAVRRFNLIDKVVATLLFYSPAKLRVARNVMKCSADCFVGVINADILLKVCRRLSTK